mgnify:CR=1 FL=1
MVEVFRTDVDSQQAAKYLLELLSDHLGITEANFDLDDCDRIFRVVCCPSEKIPDIMQVFRSQGYFIDILPD